MTGPRSDSGTGVVMPERRRALFWKNNTLLIVAALALGLAPRVAGTYTLNIITEVLIFGLFAMSLDLLMGYTGLVSLGHAAFFGLGAYTAGIVAREVSNHLLVVLPAVILVSAGAALIIGYFCLRAVGIYFLMLTLAFSQMLYAAAHKWTWLTGGSDGLPGIPRPSLGSLEMLGVDLIESEAYFYFVLVFFLVSYLLLRTIVRSPFGLSLAGVRENDARMRSIGYNTLPLKLTAFMIAGVFAGTAGMLFAFYNFFASPHNLYWTTSGQVLVMTIIGGTGTLAGPVLGSGLILLLQNMVSTLTRRWPIIMGAIFIFFVLAARQGIMGILKEISERGQRLGDSQARQPEQELRRAPGP